MALPQREREFALPHKQAANGAHSAEATSFGPAGPGPRNRALLGVGQVQGGKREGAVPEKQAGTLCRNTMIRTQTARFRNDSVLRYVE